MENYHRAVVRVFLRKPTPVYLGTAFFIAPGYLLTAKHVLEDPNSKQYYPVDEIYLSSDTGAWIEGGERSIKSPILADNQDIAVLPLNKPVSEACCLSWTDSCFELKSGCKVQLLGYSTANAAIDNIELTISSYEGRYDLEVAHSSIAKGLSGSAVLHDGKLAAVILARHHEDNKAYLLRVNAFRDFVKQSIPPLKISKTDMPFSLPDSEPVKINPYPGLKPMDKNWANRFFGRDSALKELMTKIGEQRFVVVVGASGAGKSSLVWAGLLPRLDDPKFNKDMAKTAPWSSVRMTPTKGSEKNPVSYLASQLACRVGVVDQNAMDDWDQPKILEVLSECPTNRQELNRLLDKLVTADSGNQLLLFIDQFEELFTVVAQDDCKRFIEIIDSLIKSEKIRIVATMRAEFLGRCMESADFGKYFIDCFKQGLMLLFRPDEDALRAIVEKPAELAELEFENGLLDAIIKETGTETGNLPLMAYALELLYQQKQANKIGWQVYDALGGVKGAIAKKAQQVFLEIQRCAKNEEQNTDELLGEVFRELVEIDETTQVATRKRALMQYWDNKPNAQNLINQFVKARLLLTNDEDDGKGNHNATLEVAHEALFREWSLLREWIDARKDYFLMRKRLQRDSCLWSERKQDEAYRWVDKLALEAGHMIRDLPYTPTPLEAEFLGSVLRDDMLERIKSIETAPAIRATIGVRLALLGDDRPGVGIKNGLPELVWCEIPAGEVILEEIDRHFTVEAFQISKYPITQAQFRCFIDAEDGFKNPD